MFSTTRININNVILIHIHNNVHKDYARSVCILFLFIFCVCYVFVVMLSLTYLKEYVQQPELVVNCALDEYYRFSDKSVEVKEKTFYVVHVKWL